MIRRMGRTAAVTAVVMAACMVAGCGSGGRTPNGATARPEATARLQIVSPQPNEVVGPNVTLKLDLIGGTIVAFSSTKNLKPNEGHIHVSLDGQLVSMALGTTQQLPSLLPGTHNVRAEFVAADHLPFRTRVITFVLFVVHA